MAAVLRVAPVPAHSPSIPRALHIVCVALVALGLGEAAVTQPVSEPRFAQLDNSLRVAAVPMPDASRISVQLWYRAGWADDAPETLGACNAARHTLDACARREIAAIKPPDAAATTQLAAAGRSGPSLRFSSGTLPDAVWFAWSGPPGALPDLLHRVRALAEPGRIATCVPRSQTLAVGLGRFSLSSECASDAAPPAAMLPESVYAFALALWSTAPAQRSDDDDDGPRLTVSSDAALDFAARWFVASNAHVIVVGPAEPEPVIEQVRERFGDLPWTEPPRRNTAPARPAPERLRESCDATWDELRLSWPAPPADAPGQQAWDVVAAHLCNTVDGPLHARLATRGALPPRWRRLAWRDAGIFEVTLEFSTPQPLEAVEPIEVEVRDALRQLTQKPPEPIAFDRARALAARAARQRRSSFDAWALTLGEREVVGGDLLKADRDPDRLTVPGVDELQRIAAELLRARCVTRCASRSESRQPMECTSSRPVATPLGEATAAPTWSGDVGRVRVELFAGEAADWIEVVTLGDERLTDAMVGTLLLVGAADRSIAEFRDYLSYHGLDLMPARQGDQAGLVSRGPADRLPQMVELHRELLRPGPRPANAIEAATAAAATLTTLVAQSRRCGQAEMYIPPGAIGWHVDWPIPTSEGVFREHVATIPDDLRASVRIRGPVSPEAARGAVAEAWDRERPGR